MAPTTFPQFIRQSDQMVEQATQGWGVDPKHQRLLAFGAKQWLEMLSPANAAVFNPVVLKRTIAEQGANLARGRPTFSTTCVGNYPASLPRERRTSSLGAT